MSDLMAICQVCHEEIAGRSGCAWIPFDDIRAVLSDDGGPIRILWRITHDKCATGPANGSYELDTAELQTWDELYAWTEHLMTKPWVARTDWHRILLGLARGTGPIRRRAQEAAA